MGLPFASRRGDGHHTNGHSQQAHSIRNRTIHRGLHHGIDHPSAGTASTHTSRCCVLGVVERFLSHAQLVQLSLTEVIALSPGAQAQFIHRDELLLDAYPFDNSYEVYSTRFGR